MGLKHRIRIEINTETELPESTEMIPELYEDISENSFELRSLEKTESPQVENEQISGPLVRKKKKKKVEKKNLESILTAYHPPIQPENTSEEKPEDDKNAEQGQSIK